MGPRIHTLSPTPTLIPQPINLQTHLYPSIFTPPHLTKPILKPYRISCTKDKGQRFKDEMLDLELRLELKILKSHIADREEALKKSRELLFREVCSFLGLKDVELRKKWKRMSEEERLGLAKGFVAEWSAHFHPLSAKSVKEMVEEHLGQRDDETSSGGNSSLFPGFRKLLGFESCDE